MTARSKLVFVAIAVAPIIAISVACGSAFAPQDPADASAADATPDGGNATDATDAGNVSVGANEDVAPDGASEDATTRDGASVIDAAGCTCDCDTDGFQPTSGACDGGPGPRPDCDDFDDLIKPTAGFVAAAWTSTHMPAGDWNCDGMRTKQLDYNQKCNDPTNCNGKSGFDGDPSCGATALFNTCSYSPGVLGVTGASCKVGSTSMVTQACK